MSSGILDIYAAAPRTLYMNQTRIKSPFVSLYWTDHDTTPIIETFLDIRDQELLAMKMLA